MKVTIQKALFASTLICSFLIMYFSFQVDYSNIAWGRTVFLFFILILHLSTSNKKDIFYVWVISAFFLSSVFMAIFQLSTGRLEFLILFNNICYLLGIGMIFGNIVSKTKGYLVVTNYYWLIFLIIIIDAYLIYEIMGVLNKYGIGFDHSYFGFFYSIAQLVLLSAGIVYYLANSQKEKIASFLVCAVACLFLGDVAEHIQFLLFTFDNEVGLAILESGFFIIGIYFFYMYCTLKKVHLLEDDLVLKKSIGMRV